MENSYPASRVEAFPVGLRVLVVDDDPTWLKILEKMLRKCSYEVTTCGLARVALDMLRERKDRFDIVISDVNMPDMDGFKLLEQVGLEMDLPVIMMSVDGETSRVMKGVQHGACDYLLKPVRMKELRNIWQHVFRKKIHEIKEIESYDSNEDNQMMRNRLEEFDERQMLIGGGPTSTKKRKDVDNKEQDFSDPASVKKTRVVWSVDLHQKFVNAVNQIGFDKVGPKKILDLMDVSGLTRENVASHLQKYRLYLSRLQKQNEGQTYDGIMQSDFSSKDPPGIQLQDMIPTFSGDDSKRISSFQPTETRKALNNEITQSQKVNDVSMFDIVTSSESRRPNVDYKPNEISISKHQSWGAGNPVMQFMQYLKPDQESFTFAKDYSHLQQPGEEYHVGDDHLRTPPPVSSITSTTGEDIAQIKPVCADYRSNHVRNLPPLSCKINSASVQIEHGFIKSHHFEAASSINGSSSIKSCYSDQNCINIWESPSQKLNLKADAALTSSTEDLPLDSLQGYGCYENGGLNNFEIFEYKDPTSMTEFQSNLYDELQYNCEYLFDLMECPLIDDGLYDLMECPTIDGGLFT